MKRILELLKKHMACPEGLEWAKGFQTDAEFFLGLTAADKLEWCAWVMSRVPELIEPLIAAGADVNAKNNNGDTALMWAARNGYAKVVSLLKQSGAK